MVTLRVGVRQQVEKNYGISDKVAGDGDLGKDLDLQLSVSKNRVLISMKSFPNNERFWQYNWAFFSYVVPTSEGGDILCPLHRRLPISCGPHVGKLSFLGGVCDCTSSA